MDHEPDHLAITLPGVPASVPAARLWARRRAAERGAPAAVVDDVELATSELATSAVHRGPATFTLKLTARAGRARVEVHHNGLTSHSPVGEPDLDEGRQVSLSVLAGIGEVGHSIDVDGSLMWAELRCPPWLSYGNV